jgi:hypothetical protein
MEIPKNIKRKILKLCEKYKVDNDLIDIHSLFDRTLNEEENLSFFKEIIEEMSNTNNVTEKIKTDKKVKKETIKSEKEEKERLELEGLKKEAEYSEKEFEKSINEIKFKTTNILEKKFKVTKALITTLTKSENINGLILKGGSGIGKSYTCLKTLKDLGMKKGKDFEIYNSYTTPLEFYSFLYENKDNKILILDDTSCFFENKINIGIVLASLWGEGKRVVNYSSSSGRLKVPNSFIFNSKIVWCVNDLPKGTEAVVSRCFFHTIKFNYKEKIELLYEIAKIKKMPLELIDFIKENSDELTPSLDLRLSFKIYDIYLNNPKNWKDIAIDLLGKSEKLILLKKFLDESVSIKEAEKKYCEAQGCSRATFYNTKKCLKV